MKKLITGIVMASFVLLGPVATYAQTSSTTPSAQIQSLLTQIQNLQAQVKAMQDLQTQIKTAQTGVKNTLSLIRNLREGMSGDDVAALQTILASDPTIYPQGNVSGYYGKLTSEALKKFQKKHGIEAVGYAGPKTLKKLNEVIKELGLAQVRDIVNSATTTPITGQPTIAYKGNKFCIPPGHLIAKGWQKKNQLNPAIVTICNEKYEDDDDDDTPIDIRRATPTLTNTASASVVVGGTIRDTATLSIGQSPTGTLTFNVYAPSDTTCSTPLVTPALSTTTVNGNGNYVSANFTTSVVGIYRFTASYIGDQKNYPVSTACNAPGSTVSVIDAYPQTDTTAPVISAINTSSLLATTTNIVWTTNELSNSKVWFGTSSPLNLTLTPVSITNLVTSHSVPLSGLATSTVYYYVVGSSDSSGNAATSTQATFTTTSGL
jgi:hypothetical protein